MLRRSIPRLFKRRFSAIARPTSVSVTRHFTNPVQRSSLVSLRVYSVASTDGHDIPSEVLNLSVQEYQKEADRCLETLLDDLETLSDEYPERIPDVELTQGVMTLQVANVGTYVINKQPPNKQIWLSSPISGPNRFDLYKGDWVSLRDGSRLLSILSSELDDAIPEQDIQLRH
ncbi:hypothetical protein HG537_0A02330 [Torulaspora globosa]|uniref:ferroxidase n=1 Tax=Torulaspora globosa TaxID=48254 RepID=A0A7H9HKV0_9SACH|nr:hypothetical protein HG537_0A02330 [Torulaspora sp. CBS 2947]